MYVFVADEDRYTGVIIRYLVLEHDNTYNEMWGFQRFTAQHPATVQAHTLNRTT